MKKIPRQQRYAERMKAAGFRLVCVWVPAEMVDRLKAFGAKLRSGKE